MSRHQQTHSEDRATEDNENQVERGADLPATAIVRRMLASGRADPAAIAHLVASHPRASHEIFMLLNKTVGQGFASEVFARATSDEKASSGLGAPRDVVSFDQRGEYAESRATIDNPRTEADDAPDTTGEYREARATIDNPIRTKDEPPWAVRARRYNRAHADNVRAFLEATGSQCVEEGGELDPSKVARWQADHGLSPDGRVGDMTVRAAVTDPSLAL